MWDFVRLLLDTADFPARWHCGRWSSGLGWLHIVSDLLTFAAYTAIPIIICVFIARRRDIAFPRVLWLFIAFIFSCGMVHLVEAIIFWHPIYRISGVLKLCTAVVSVTTAMSLIHIMPQALQLPGIARLNTQLHNEIAERKRREAERDQFFALSPDLMCILDGPSGRFITTNEAFVRLLGYSTDQLHTMAWMDLLHPDDRPEGERLFKQLQEGRELRDWRVRCRCWNQSYRWMTWSIAIDRHEEQCYATARDIDERLALEHERRAYEERLNNRQRLESLGLLAGGIAHDFNNLLTSMVGNLDLLKQDLRRTHHNRESIEQLEAAARQATDLCKQMLAYSGQGRFVVERVELSEVIRDVTDLLRISVPPRVELDVQFASTPCIVQADVTQLRQVVMNLVTNAAEAIDAESGRVTVRTSIHELNGLDLKQLSTTITTLQPGIYARLEVSDTGVGMDDETQRRIFEPFFSTKFTGRGLGLAAVQGIVRAHKGTIRITSAPGEGTTFIIDLPFVGGRPVGRHSSAYNTPLTPAKAIALHAHDTQPITVLVVDDEQAVRRMAQRLLKRQGFEVLLAEHGREALDIYATHGTRIHAIILDMTMPVLNGAETLKALREQGATVPILLSSGYTADEVLTTHAISPDGFLPKPYRGRELLALLNHLLQTHDPKPNPTP